MKNKIFPLIAAGTLFSACGTDLSKLIPPPNEQQCYSTECIGEEQTEVTTEVTSSNDFEYKGNLEGLVTRINPELLSAVPECECDVQFEDYISAPVSGIDRAILENYFSKVLDGYDNASTVATQIVESIDENAYIRVLRVDSDTWTGYDLMPIIDYVNKDGQREYGAIWEKVGDKNLDSRLVNSLINLADKGSFESIEEKEEFLRNDLNKYSGEVLEKYSLGYLSDGELKYVDVDYYLADINAVILTNTVTNSVLDDLSENYDVFELEETRKMPIREELATYFQD